MVPQQTINDLLNAYQSWSFVAVTMDLNSFDQIHILKTLKRSEQEMVYVVQSGEKFV